MHHCTQGVITTRTVPILEVDDVAPTVEAIEPEGTPLDAPVDTPISVSFSEKMDSNSLDCTTFTLAPAPPGGCIGIFFDAEGKKASLAHAGLAPDTSYTATVTTAATTGALPEGSIFDMGLLYT